MKKRPVLSVGIHVAEPNKEFAYLTRILGPPSFKRVHKNYEIPCWSEDGTLGRWKNPKFRVSAIVSTPGEAPTAAAVQFLIDKMSPDLMINFGLVGALIPELKIGDLCAVTTGNEWDFLISSAESETVLGQFLGLPRDLMADLDYTSRMCRLLGIQARPITSGNKFVFPDQKPLLHSELGAEIVDMEAAAFLRTCYMNDVPAVMLKGVSDAIDDGVEVFNENVNVSEKIAEALVTFLDDLANNPRMQS